MCVCVCVLEEQKFIDKYGILRKLFCERKKKKEKRKKERKQSEKQRGKESLGRENGKSI